MPAVIFEPKVRQLYVRIRSDLKFIDAMGNEIKTRTPFVVVDRWLCVVTTWVRSTELLHLVRFRDGTECWVSHSECRWVDEVISAA